MSETCGARWSNAAISSPTNERYAVPSRTSSDECDTCGWAHAEEHPSIVVGGGKRQRTLERGAGLGSLAELSPRQTVEEPELDPRGVARFRPHELEPGLGAQREPPRRSRRPARAWHAGNRAPRTSRFPARAALRPRRHRPARRADSAQPPGTFLQIGGNRRPVQLAECRTEDPQPLRRPAGSVDRKAVCEQKRRDGRATSGRLRPGRPGRRARKTPRPATRSSQWKWAHPSARLPPIVWSKVAPAVSRRELDCLGSELRRLRAAGRGRLEERQLADAVQIREVSVLGHCELERFFEVGLGERPPLPA